MKENSTIYLNNFYDRTTSFAVKFDNIKESINNITGLHPKVEKKIAKYQAISEIFKSLLIHDYVIINFSDLNIIIDAFGVLDTIELLKTDKLKVLSDLNLSPVIGYHEDKFYFTSIHLRGNDNNQLSSLEEDLSNKKFTFSQSNQLLLTNIESRIISIDIGNTADKIQEELKYDMNNHILQKYLEFENIELDNLNKDNVYNVLRLGKLNQSLIMSSFCNADAIGLDGAIKDILGYKFSPLIKEKITTNIFDDFFVDIFEKKKIPDLSTLYIKKIITISDYIGLLNTFGAKKFRNWISDRNYDPKLLEVDILNSSTKIGSTFQRFILWSLPNLVGLVMPALSAPTSFGKSYLLDKFLSGWHPNLYLDDVLKSKIDKKIQNYKNAQNRRKLKKRFPNVGRNDKCPCKSGKKFKSCCGKL